MCGNLILPEAIDYVYFYMKLNLRNLLYVIDLKKLYDVRKGYQKDLIMKALETSSFSLDEILSFINTTIEDAKGCED